MKIICTDNFNRETVSDRLVAENVDKGYASLIVRLLNEHAGEYSENYFQVVEDEHKLFEYEP